MSSEIRVWEHKGVSGYQPVAVPALSDERDFNEAWHDQHQSGGDESVPLLFISHAHHFSIMENGNNQPRVITPRFIYLMKTDNHIKVMASRERVSGYSSIIHKPILYYLDGIYGHGACPEISEEYFGQLAAARCLH